MRVEGSKLIEEAFSTCSFDFFQVVAPINKLIETVPFDVFAYSLDWHPSDHVSFVDNVQNRKLHDTSKVSERRKGRENSKLHGKTFYDGLMEIRVYFLRTESAVS